MAELLIRGKGRPAAPLDDAMATQAALVAHRARRVKARSAVKNHVHASLDLVFPSASSMKLGPSSTGSTPEVAWATLG